MLLGDLPRDVRQVYDLPKIEAYFRATPAVSARAGIARKKECPALGEGKALPHIRRRNRKKTIAYKCFLKYS